MLGLGLISGTSADGVSAALIELKRERVHLIACRNYGYPALLRRKVLKAAAMKAPQLSQLNFELGAFFAACARKFLKEHKFQPKHIAAIGSHGQTVYHGPQDKPQNTLQIAEPAVIAEHTGIAVVADFRPRDIAAGGEGAPLVPFFDWYLHRQEAPMLILNIGGIANITVVSKAPDEVMGFDTGPGNCLLDLAISQKSKGRLLFDAGGALAFQGRVDEAAVRRALRDAYFTQRPPKSTGRQYFDLKFIRRYFKRIFKYCLEDTAATLAAFTADSIYDACCRFIFPKIQASKMIVSGGGSNNVFLLSRLGARLKQKNKNLVLTAEEGFPAQAREPAAFALMALMAIQGKPNHLPAATGARASRILGAIYPASAH